SVLGAGAPPEAPGVCASVCVTDAAMTASAATTATMIIRFRSLSRTIISFCHQVRASLLRPTSWSISVYLTFGRADGPAFNSARGHESHDGGRNQHHRRQGPSESLGP